MQESGKVRRRMAWCGGLACLNLTNIVANDLHDDDDELMILKMVLLLMTETEYKAGVNTEESKA